ncbi:UPF0058 family protein [Halegenticoccus tardaugens]|uniref:UPF0058 family protein n=1 Tax=Halegenticoccus tardaugens TaxID=2071624 RepID=UPI00100A6B3A|nr:UPF0058 family protein [Halegenticoccus tardaugens]
MKKQELIHLHGLLAEVQNQCEKWEGREFEMSEYETLGVRPTSIHKSKTDHKAAVFELARGITSSMGEAESEALAPQAD